MARIGLLAIMVGALSLGAVGTGVSRTTAVTLAIPPISLLSLPERNASGTEVAVELGPEDFEEGKLLPLEVKSNVPWAVTARLLTEGAELRVEVLGGPEVVVNTEEVPLLFGRPGKHEALLRVRFLGPIPQEVKLSLVLKVRGLESGARRG